MKHHETLAIGSSNYWIHNPWPNQHLVARPGISRRWSKWSRNSQGPRRNSIFDISRAKPIFLRWKHARQIYNLLYIFCVISESRKCTVSKLLWSPDMILIQEKFGTCGNTLHHVTTALCPGAICHVGSRSVQARSPSKCQWGRQFGSSFDFGWKSVSPEFSFFFFFFPVWKPQKFVVMKTTRRWSKTPRPCPDNWIVASSWRRNASWGIREEMLQCPRRLKMSTWTCLTTCN